MAEFNISDLVRNPSQVIEHVDRGEQVILHRRGREDLKLMLASIGGDRSPLLDEALARIVAALFRMDRSREEIRQIMTKVYPWLRLFSDESDRDACVQDLLDVAVACASVGNFAAFHGKVASWRSTAEIYSDPELFARLSGPAEIEDLGPVPVPEVPEEE